MPVLVVVGEDLECMEHGGGTKPPWLTGNGNCANIKEHVLELKCDCTVISNCTEYLIYTCAAPAGAPPPT